MGLENEDFSDEDQCQCMYTWEFFAYIFCGIRKTQMSFTLENFNLEYSDPFYFFFFIFFFFFHYCHRHH